MYQDINIEELRDEYNELAKKLVPNGVYATVNTNSKDSRRWSELKEIIERYDNENS